MGAKQADELDDWMAKAAERTGRSSWHGNRKDIKEEIQRMVEYNAEHHEKIPMIKAIERVADKFKISVSRASLKTYCRDVLKTTWTGASRS